jgi:hypothetical protein
MDQYIFIFNRYHFFLFFDMSGQEGTRYRLLQELYLAPPSSLCGFGSFKQLSSQGSKDPKQDNGQIQGLGQPSYTMNYKSN